MKRVLVVARSAATRAGLESLLARSGEFLVVGSSAWAPAPVGDAVPAGLDGERLADAEPELVLLALEPGEDPPLPLALPPDSATRAPAVVVLGSEPLDAWGRSALRQGAAGVLPRGATPREIIAALDAASAGLVAMPPALAGAPARGRTAARTDGRAPALSPRESEILSLLASGLGNRAIAARLHISEHTVKSHVMSLFARLGVSTRAEAVAAGVRLGILML